MSNLERKIASAEAYASEYVNPRDFSSSSAERAIWKAVRAGYMQGQDDLWPMIRSLREALEAAVRECPYSCLEGDCAAEWEMETKACPFCTKARAVLKEN